MNGDCGQLEHELSVKGSCGPALDDDLPAKLEITLPDLVFFCCFFFNFKNGGNLNFNVKAPDF